MSTAIMVLSLALGLVFLLLIATILHITKLQEQVNLLDKEQHTQNKEIGNLIKGELQHKEMLLQHIEVLRYLCEQDPKLNSNAYILMGKAGEA